MTFSAADYWRAQAEREVETVVVDRFEPSVRVRGEVFLQTREWRAVRTAFLATVPPICARCGATSRLVVDHIESRKRRPDLALTATNLQVLCWTCNGRKANRRAD